MSWIDNWDIHADTGVTVFTVVSGERVNNVIQPDPQEGNGWIHCAFLNVATSVNLTPKASFAPGAGVLQGALRCFVHGIGSGSHIHNSVGLICLLNQKDQTNGNGGRGYGAFIYDIGSGFKLRLVKLTSGLGDSAAELVLGPTTAVPCALELRWDALPATVVQMGGPVLRVRSGANFNSLVDVPGMENYVDVTSPYITTVSEGPGIYRVTGFFDGYVDHTGLRVP